jgi:hypothetical protein
MPLTPRNRLSALQPGGQPPPRLGQGYAGGIRSLQPSLIQSRNPGLSGLDPRARLRGLDPLPSKKAQSLDPTEAKWEKFQQHPRTLVHKMIEDKKRQSFALGPARLTDEDIADLRKMGVDKDMIPLLQDVVRGKREFGGGHDTHRSGLGWAWEGLKAIEGTGAGFWSGTKRYQREHGYKGDIADPRAYFEHPSRIYKELKAGFVEIPTAVRKDQSYADTVREVTDPNSLTHRFAMPIGLGMAVLFDPTTYLSFGATSVSKTAAAHLLAESNRATSIATRKLIKDNFGKTIDTDLHGPIRANWKNFDEIHMDVKFKKGAPFTLGDTLEQLKYQGLQMKDTVRRTGEFVDPKLGMITKATVRQKVGAVVAPNNVLGGRGVRFMGKELPGTVAAGSKLSGMARGSVVGDTLRARVAEGFGEALVPDWAARHIAEDAKRASALVEGARIKSALQAMQTDVGRNVREMQRPFVEIADDTEEDVLHSLAPGVEGAISGAKQRVLVRPEARRGILDASDEGLDLAQRAIKNNILKAADDQIEFAVKAGIPRSSVTKLWDDLVKHYDDPLRALAEFKFKASARAMGKTWVKEILADPRFAFPMKPILSEQQSAKALKMAAKGAKTTTGKAVTVHPDMLDEVPTGYVEFMIGSQRWAVSDSMIDAVRDLTNPARLDGQLQRGFKRLNIVQDWWKLYATSPNPSFHVMNMLGAIWNNALAHVYNPGDYFDAMELLYRGRKEEAAIQGAKFGLTRRVPQSTPEGKHAQAVLSEAESRSGLGRSSFLFGDVTRGHFSPSQLAMSDQPMSETAPMFEQFAGEILSTGRGLMGRQLLPQGGFREAPTVTTQQVKQSIQHAEVPAPIELTHPALIPDTLAPFDEQQRKAISAVMSRHTHEPDTAMLPTVEITAYHNELQEAVKMEGANLESIMDLLEDGKKLGLSGAAKKPDNWDAFHNAVIKDLNRLNKETEVQFIPSRFPAKPFKTPGELVPKAGQNAPAFGPLRVPTPAQMNQGARHVPIMVDKKNFDNIYVGNFDDTPEDVLGRWQAKGMDDPDAWTNDYFTGIGTFNDEGVITSVENLSDELAPKALDKANEVYAKVGDKRVFRKAPSPAEIAEKYYLHYFRVYQDPKNPDYVIAGMPSHDHSDVVQDLGLDEAEMAMWHQGTGVFDPDTGKIHKVTIVRTGNDEWDVDAVIPDNAEELSERAFRAARELYGEIGAPPVNVAPEILRTETPGALRKKAIARQYGVTLPRKIAGTALLATGNPIGFMAFMPELARAGRRVSGTIEDMVRLAPFLKYSDNKQIAAVLREWGPINSAMMDIDYTGFSKADQAVMYDIGAHISRQFQFDYSNLTNFERYVAKSIFPFWTYYKNNLALQVQQIVKQPRLFGVALKTMNYINDNGENYNMKPWDAILPAYFENLQAFQVPVPNSIRKQLGLPEDMPLFLNPKMPFLSINLIPPLWDILQDPSKTTPQRMREIVAPVAGAWGPFSPFPLGPGSKILLEAGTGYNLGLNRPIDWRRVESGDTQQAYTEAPPFMKYLPDKLNKYFGLFKHPETGKLMISQTGKYVVEQMTTPFINNLGSAVPLQGGTEEDIGRQKADLVSWLSGVRLIPADVLRLNRNSAYTLLNALEAKQDRLETQGKTMSEKDLEMLAIVRADLIGIEATWDMREMEAEEEKNAP